MELRDDTVVEQGNIPVSALLVDTKRGNGHDMNFGEELHNILKIVWKEKAAIDLVIKYGNVLELCEESNLGGRMQIAETVHNGGDSNISDVEFQDGREVTARICNNWSSLRKTGRMSHYDKGEEMHLVI